MVDVAIDYNLLLGCNGTYAMTTILSSIFRVLQFPHEGNIVTIDQLSFTLKNPNSPTDSIIPSSDKSSPVIENVGVGLYPSLMGTFSIPSPLLFVGYSSTFEKNEALVSTIQSLKMTYIDDPWFPQNP